MTLQIVTRHFECVDQNSNRPLVDAFEVLIIVELVCALDANVVFAHNASDSICSTVLKGLFYFTVDS
jgi:hypothetical protein